MEGGHLNVHDFTRVPVDGVVVEIGCRIKPQVELLLSVPFSFSEDVCVDSIRLSWEIAQELKVDLIMPASNRR